MLLGLGSQTSLFLAYVVFFLRHQSKDQGKVNSVVSTRQWEKLGYQPSWVVKDQLLYNQYDIKVVLITRKCAISTRESAQGTRAATHVGPGL